MLHRVCIQPSSMLGTRSDEITLAIEESGIVRLLDILLTQRYAKVVALAVQHVALAPVGRKSLEHLLQIGCFSRKLLDLGEAKQMYATLIPDPRSRHRVACQAQAPGLQPGNRATKTSAGLGGALPLALRVGVRRTGRFCMTS